MLRWAGRQQGQGSQSWAQRGVESDPQLGGKLPGRATGRGTEGEQELAGKLGWGPPQSRTPASGSCGHIWATSVGTWAPGPAVFQSGQAQSREARDIWSGVGWHSLACHRTLLSSNSSVTLQISHVATTMGLQAGWHGKGRVDLRGGRQAVCSSAGHLMSLGLLPPFLSKGQ